VIAATDNKVATALTERMTNPRLITMRSLFDDPSAMMAENRRAQNPAGCCPIGSRRRGAGLLSVFGDNLGNAIALSRDAAGTILRSDTAKRC
jgi:hypothetical protein